MNRTTTTATRTIPTAFFERLRKEFRLGVSVQPTETATGATIWRTPAHPDLTDAAPLTDDWAALATTSDSRAVWLNLLTDPTPQAWLAKARSTASSGTTVVALVPTAMSAPWWCDHVLASGAEIRFVRGRLRCNRTQHVADAAAAVVIFRPDDTSRRPKACGTIAAKPLHVDPAKTPDALIDNYWATSMPPEQFAWADQAIKDAARAAKPTSFDTAKRYVTSLTVFLLGPCGWDRRSVPDLKALLTKDAILAVTAQMPATSRTTTVRRETLMDLGRKIGTLPASTHQKTTRTMNPDRFVLAGSAQQLPVAAVIQAHAIRSTTAPAQRLLVPAYNRLRSNTQAGAQPAASATLSSASIRALAEARSPKVMPMANSKPASSSQAKAGKPISRAQRIAFAKISQQQAQLLNRAPATLADLPALDTSGMDPQVLAECRSFTPRADRVAAWEHNIDLARHLLIGSAPTSVRSAKNLASCIARFIAWYDRWPGRMGAISGDPITPAELLAPGLVEIFATMQDLPGPSAATYRSAIRRALRTIDPAPQSVRRSHRVGSPPYTTKEIDDFAFLAKNQRNHGPRVALCTAIAMGAGAGLDTSDLRNLTPAHLELITIGDSTVMMVHVEGPRARSVPMRAQFVDLMFDALESHRKLGKSDDEPLIGRNPDRINVMRPLTRKARTASGERIEVHQARLRNTWIVAAMCAAVPLSELMNAAGLTSPRTLELLLEYCPAQPPQVIHTVLAALEGVPTGTGVRTSARARASTTTRSGTDGPQAATSTGASR
ncbi:site-specific integrase [Janibacter melonis]|uniref:site-specific integrase n=1 Tax=Janibacter melonis TaxID=262209 RepID=UPI00191A82D5|nr:site-specific integrase [Janibacter melonis]